MELDELIKFTDNYLKFGASGIKIPSFYFNGIEIKDMEFTFMGEAKSPENKGKYIFLSKNIIAPIYIKDLLKLNGEVREDKSVGECDIFRIAAEYLDKEVFKITGNHIKPYTRTYDDHTYNEKLFLPLECEVLGDIEYSLNVGTAKRYPRWTGFSKGYFDKKLIGDKSIFLWNANKAGYPHSYCSISGEGYPLNIRLDSRYYTTGIVLAFCI